MQQPNKQTNGSQTPGPWKAVGSPARRASFRTRAASTPNSALPPGLSKSQGSAPVVSPNSHGSSGNAAPKWNSSPSWSNTSSTKSHSHSLWGNIAKPTIKSVIVEEGEADDMKTYRHLMASTASPQADIILSQDEYDAIPKSRSRSKSSSAIYVPTDDEILAPIDMPSIWAADPSNHRRASTQPSQQAQQSYMWDAMVSAQLATPQDMNGAHADELLNTFRQHNADSHQRRFSVAPSAVNRFIGQNADFNHVDPAPPTGRRHSLASPQGAFDRKLNSKFINGFEGMTITEPHMESIDDYFGNTSQRKQSLAKAGKNLHAQAPLEVVVSPPPAPSHRWPLYVVEFKAGRTDYFYSTDDIVVKKGDLCIVEADRGKDLGKVIHTGINNMQELDHYQQKHTDSLVDSHNAVGKEIQPKRIFRIAQSNEISLLLPKSQDEAKAAQLCQVKIRQKKLLMEIVDAEYQWDRRKLTLYFVADGRIDFRELVRELFKIYKTRIWMCILN
jgi:PSP1 C-terminal conserved region